MKTVINYNGLVCANQHTSKDTKPQTPLKQAETSVLALSLISAATNAVYLITTFVSLLAD